MTYTSEKYKPRDNRYNPPAPKPDLKSCLIWFIVFIVFVGLIVGISIVFGQWKRRSVLKTKTKAKKNNETPLIDFRSVYHSRNLCTGF